VQARELAETYPTIDTESTVLEAARTLAERRLPGLIVVDEVGHPRAVLPASQVLRLLIPQYVQDDPTLARVLDDSGAEVLIHELEGKTVAELLRGDHLKPPVARPDDTVMEVAAMMSSSRSPLVAVVADEEEGRPLIGVITVTRLLGHILSANGRG
jgi:CBS domain-containing protein